VTEILPGYLVVIDAEGAEVPDSRRDITGLSREQALAIRAKLEAGLGPDCHVEFKAAGRA
jgi:hypothetical protein